MAKEVMKFSDSHKKRRHTRTHLPLPSMRYMSQSRLDCGLIESRSGEWVFEVWETWGKRSVGVDGRRLCVCVCFYIDTKSDRQV